MLISSVNSPSSLEPNTDCRVQKLQTARAYEDFTWSGTGFSLKHNKAIETGGRFPLHQQVVQKIVKLKVVKQEFRF